MRVSWVVVACSKMDGNSVAREKMTSMGMRTAKADFRGIPQSL